MNWFVRYKFYLLSWVVLLAYLLLADQIYLTLFAKNGKPVREPAGTFVPTDKVKAAVDYLLEHNYEGQEIYELRGWAFSPLVTNLDDMEMKLVLRSAQEDLVFSRNIWNRERLNEAFPEFNMDLGKAGYRVLIAKQALDVAKYEIGILIIDKNTGTQYFLLTRAFIERTPNTMRLIKPR